MLSFFDRLEAPIELLNVASDDSSVEIADDMKSADITFKATADSQSIKIRYTINAIPYAGKWVVVFEELKYRGNTIAVHKDIDDSHQSLVFSNQGDLYIEKFDGYTGEAISGGSLLFNLYAVQNGKEVLMKNAFVCQSNPIMGAYQYTGDDAGYVDTDETVNSDRTDLHPYYYAGAAPAGNPGTLTVYGLPAGEYVLKEKSAPDGYKADITNGETFEISAGETTELGIANSPTMIDLKLVKTDDGKGDDIKHLEGVGFTLYTDEDCKTPAKDFYGEEIGELITGSDGLLTAEKIRYNTKKETVYYISETTPLDGYQPLEYAIKAVIDTGGNVKLYKPTDEGYEEITDTVSLRLDSSEDDTELPRVINRRKGKITVWKKALDTKLPLAGVVMNITDSEHNILTFSKGENNEYVPDENGSPELVTDAEGKIVIADMKYGTYYLSETVSAQGYQLLKEEVEIILDSPELSKEMYNTPTSDFPIAGGFDKTIFISVGMALIFIPLTIFIFKRKGKFKMKTKRLFSFLIAMLMTFSVFAGVGTTAFAADGVSKNLIDETKTGSLTLYKYEMEDEAYENATTPGDGTYTDNLPAGAKPIEGVEFTLYKIKDLTEFFNYDSAEDLPKAADIAKNEAAYIGSNTWKSSGYTTSEGKITFTNLALGVYYVKETFAPAQVRQQAAPFVISVPTTTADKTAWMYDITVQPKNQTKYANVTLHKYDLNSDDPLEGFHFTLERKNITKDKQVSWVPVGGTYTSAGTGEFTVTHLPTHTDYRFREISADDKSYIVDSTVYYGFTINDDGTVTYTHGDVNDSADIHDKADGEVVEDNKIKVPNEDVTIDKEVSTDKTSWHQDVTQDINKEVYWKVTTSVPSLIGKMSKYVITDTLSEGCTYKSVELIGVKADGSEATISAANYSVDHSKIDSKNNNIITVSITNFKALEGFKELKTVFTTVLNEKAIIGGDNPNTAELDYTNDIQTDSTYNIKSRTPEVHTGGYAWKKVDIKGDTLAGVEFSVYRTLSDAQQNINPIKFELKDGVYYTDDKNLSGNASATVISGADGMVNVRGLLYGAADNLSSQGEATYYVAEIKTAKGCQLLKKPFEITINSTSHNYNKDINVTTVNTEEVNYPHTGGNFSWLLAVASGIGIVCAGIAVLFIKSKKRKCAKSE